MTTRTRKDVALKLKERSKHDQKVVKCFLSSLLVNQDNKQQIQLEMTKLHIVNSRDQASTSKSASIVILRQVNNVTQKFYFFLLKFVYKLHLI